MHVWMCVEFTFAWLEKEFGANWSHPPTNTSKADVDLTNQQVGYSDDKDDQEDDPEG